jgi:hypothetical protein
MFNSTGDRGTTHKITNCIFWKNSAERLGGAICNSVSSQLITNCTFYGNSAIDGGAIQGGFSSSPTIQNCIIWRNGNEPIANRDSEFDVPIVNYTDIDRGYRGGIGNIDQEPSFINPEDTDGADNILGTADDGLNLTQCSPVINKGNNASIVKFTDFTGINRIQQSIVDMGAYESNYLPTTYQSTLYVKENAMGANDGTSWANAFTDLQSALDFGCYDEIKVAAGTYKPSKDVYGNFLPTNPRDKTFYLPNSKRIYGGFAGNETGYEQRNPIAYPTILSGDIGVVGDNSDNAYHVLITAGSGSSTYLDGFTITKGNANSNQEYVIVVNGKSIHGNTGGGMVNYESSPGISKCIFTENNSSWEGGGVYNFKGARIFTECVFSKNNAHIGGGMNNTISSPDIIGCKFIDNYAISGGGGLLNYDSSSPRITHSIFSGNSAGAGGGMYNQVSSSPQVINCTFSTNNAFDGGGMNNVMESSPTIINCNFSNNSAEKGGGMEIDGGLSTIRNCTFYGNSASYYYGGGIYNLTNGTVIVNSIFWGNKKGFATIIPNSIEGEPANITYSDVEGGYTGTGNINQDPLFVNQNDIDGDDNIFGTSDDGLELRDGSPCINSGAFLDSSIPDITGTYRAQQGAFDMGAYESPYSFNQCQTLTWQQGGVTTCDGKATFTIKVSGLVGNNIAQFSIDRINWFDATANGNTYTFKVPQQGICRGFFARPKGCTDESKIIWGCYLDTYPGYPVSCEPCSSDLIWIQGGVITCNGKAKMTIKVLGLKVNTVAEFSIDNINWYDATADGNTYTFTVPQQGICRSFWARPKGCTNPAKVIWGCYLDTYAGYPVICTDGQIPTAIQTQSSRVASFSMDVCV